MCLAVLALDRRYSDVRPRRPEGGPDGGRDIECLRDSEICYGAVGFLNSPSDSAGDKRKIKGKFKADLQAAIGAVPDGSKLRSFVFFTNVDLTPGEQAELTGLAEQQGISFADIYWRERIRHALDSPEGLAIRFNYLSIEMSQAEQASFFSRFGSDLEQLLRGGLSSIERRIDALEFSQWQSGTIRSMTLEFDLAKMEDSPRKQTEHFRVALELHGVVDETRGIVIGGRDDFWSTPQQLFFDTKSYFWMEKSGGRPAWVPRGKSRAGGGVISSYRFGIKWHPRSAIHVAEFDTLSAHLYLTENVTERFTSARLLVDSYVLVESKLGKEWHPGRPQFEWPDELTAEESKLEWKRSFDIGQLIWFRRVPRKVGI
jgi:hypothetical protein